MLMPYMRDTDAALLACQRYYATPVAARHAACSMLARYAMSPDMPRFFRAPRYRAIDYCYSADAIMMIYAATR